MKNLVPLSFALLFCLAIAVGGCAGQGQRAFPATTPSPVPTPSTACTLPPGTTTIALAYPIPNATGVQSLPSAQPNGIVLSVYPSPLPSGWYLYVVSSGSGGGIAAQGGPTALPSILPTPIATPFPNSTYEFFDFGQFALNTSFEVYVSQTNCYPGLNIGGFTSGNS